MRSLGLLFFALLLSRSFGAQDMTASPALRAGDVFDMKVSGVPLEYAQEFSLQITVGQDGNVNMPLIGEVKAMGLTAADLERSLQRRLVAERIFTQPTVIINMVQGVRTVSVNGGVKNPQRLIWSGDLTLGTAIGGCGGLADFGRSSGIRLIRASKLVGTFNLKSIGKDPSLDPKLLPGDQVWVQE